MQSRKLSIRKIVSIVVILIGLTIMLQYPVRNFLINLRANHLLNTSTDNMYHNSQLAPLIDFDDVREVTTGAVLDATLGDFQHLVIGRLQIDAVNLDLPIINELTDRSLFLGAAIMNEGQVMGEGNYALTSHYMHNPDLLFAPLHRVEHGDKVVISNYLGSFTYEVFEIRTIPPTSTYVLNEPEDNPIITLITCTDNGRNRLLVVGNLVDYELSD